MFQYFILHYYTPSTLTGLLTLWVKACLHHYSMPTHCVSMPALHYLLIIGANQDFITERPAPGSVRAASYHPFHQE